MMHCELVYWPEVKALVQQHNPALAEIIETLDSPTAPILKLRYPFGSAILEQGRIQFPPNVRLSDHERTQLLELLNYSHIPLGLIQHKGAEIFVKDQDQIVPLNILSPGQLFGLFEVLDRKTFSHVIPRWCITAGARTTCFLPRISDRSAHNRLLRQFPVLSAPPKGLSDHWQIFQSIAQHQSIREEWYCEVLLFTKDWFSDAQSPLESYLYRIAWQQTQYARDRISFDLVWKFLSAEIQRRNFKPSMYLVDTLKHLLTIASGNTPAMKIAKDDMLIPKSWLQNIYVDHYELKDYLPTLLIPCFLQPNQNAYYSLGLPTMLTGTFDKKENMLLVKFLYEIKRFFSLLNQLEPDQLMQGLGSKIQYECYHNEENDWSILPSKQLPLDDPDFLFDAKTYPKRIFCANSPFMKGCVQIKRY